MLRLLVVLTFFLSALLAERCPNDTRCLSCTNATCNFCADGFLKKGECYAPKVEIPNCRIYNENGCTMCQRGLYLKENECKEIPIKDCLIYDDSSEKCIACKNGLKALNGLCEGEGIESCDGKCDLCNIFGCMLCPVGYAFNSNAKCVKSNVENCLHVKKDKTTCEFCLPGFYNSYGDCVRNEFDLPYYLENRENLEESESDSEESNEEETEKKKIIIPIIWRTVSKSK